MKLTDVTKKIIGVICLLTLLFTVAAALFIRHFGVLDFALGAILGAGLSVYKVISLDRMVSAAQEGRPARGIHLRYILRFLLTGGVLLVGALVPFVNFWGVVAGIFTLPLAAFSMRFVKTAD